MYTEQQLIEFGNYLLSEKRKKKYNNSPLYPRGVPTQVEDGEVAAFFAPEVEPAVETDPE